MNKKELEEFKSFLYINRLTRKYLAKEFYPHNSFITYINYYLNGYHLKIEENAKKYLKLKTVNPKSLYKYRKSKGLSQKELGKTLHVDFRVISFYERGHHIDIEHNFLDHYFSR